MDQELFSAYIIFKPQIGTRTVHYLGVFSSKLFALDAIKEYLRERISSTSNPYFEKNKETFIEKLEAIEHSIPDYNEFIKQRTFDLAFENYPFGERFFKIRSSKINEIVIDSRMI